MQIKVNKTKGSLVEVEGSISWEEFEKYQPKALKKLGENVSIPGFRPGHIPNDVLIKNIPEATLLEEMAQEFLAENYPKIIVENKIDAIGHPEIAITKIAKGNPFEFKLKTATLPEISLPDYKKIAKGADKMDEIVVTDEEIENTVKEIKRMRASKVSHENCADGECKHEEILPELNDEFVKSLGGFENVEDFKTKLIENIKLEKTHKAKEKRRINIIESISNETKTDIPELLIEVELDKMVYRLKADADSVGVKFEDYLKQINKSEEDIRKDWREGAEKRVKAELIIGEIAKAEDIKADEKDVETEVARLFEMYKDADPTKSRIYVENMLRNEKVFQFLESQ